MRKYFENLFTETFQELKERVLFNLKKEKKMFIITANPEIFMSGEKDITVNEMLISKDTTVIPDGISIVKAARFLKYKVKERMPGVELVEYIIANVPKENGKIYLFGATAEVLASLINKIKKEYSNLTIVGMKDGYETDKEKVMEEIKSNNPDIVLVALGVPRQEQLIYKYYSSFSKGIFIGVGGTFDVLSGYKKRAPKIFIKFNLEWLYRILKEPSRFKRFYTNNIKFLSKVLWRRIGKKND